MENILKVAIDAVRGNYGTYSKQETSEALRKSLVEMNGGSDKLNIKSFHRGSQLFALVEELIPVIVNSGLEESNPLFSLVEYKNIADGDLNEFYIEGECIFAVADAASGIRGVRRQRLDDGEKVTIKTSLKIARVYENLGRLMAGRISFDKFVDEVAKAFNRQILDDVYKAVSSLTSDTAGLDENYVINGVFDENKLLTLIEHVEASTGKTAKILGTKAGLRKITGANINSDSSKEDMYNIGHYGKFYGTDMVSLKQVHKVGTQEFVLNDSQVFVIASDDKPIKVVNEGEGILINREATENNDLTKEYIYGQAYGVGVICASKIGVYNIG